jgi:RimJ/RimL family protein N-acetyltransferase
MQGEVFTSEKLGFRNWQMQDITPMANINADPEVMRFFPNTQTLQNTEDFIARMQASQASLGACYFAVELLETREFIGFIGLLEQKYPADFNPSVDIGWRLAKAFWGFGYATEGARRCLAYAREELKLSKVYATAPCINLPSIRVMQKIGMYAKGVFEHPYLLDSPKLRECVVYETLW